MFHPPREMESSLGYSNNGAGFVFCLRALLRQCETLVLRWTEFIVRHYEVETISSIVIDESLGCCSYGNEKENDKFWKTRENNFILFCSKVLPYHSAKQQKLIVCSNGKPFLLWTSSGRLWKCFAVPHVTLLNSSICKMRPGTLWSKNKQHDEVEIARHSDLIFHSKCKTLASSILKAFFREGLKAQTIPYVVGDVKISTELSGLAE